MAELEDADAAQASLRHAPKPASEPGLGTRRARRNLRRLLLTLRRRGRERAAATTDGAFPRRRRHCCMPGRLRSEAAAAASEADLASPGGNSDHGRRLRSNRALRKAVWERGRALLQSGGLGAAGGADNPRTGGAFGAKDGSLGGLRNRRKCRGGIASETDSGAPGFLHRLGRQINHRESPRDLDASG